MYPPEVINQLYLLSYKRGYMGGGEGPEFVVQ